jgi:hypothetical protein
MKEEFEEGSKGIQKNPLELTPGHLLRTPSHHLLQKIFRANELMG